MGKLNQQARLVHRDIDTGKYYAVDPASGTFFELKGTALDLWGELESIKGEVSDIVNRIVLTQDRLLGMAGVKAKKVEVKKNG